MSQPTLLLQVLAAVLVQLLIALLVTTLAPASSSASAAAAAQQQRTIRPQDVDRILANDRLLTSFVNCVLDKSPCTQDGRELRKSIPQALSTGCAACSPNQRVLTERVIRHLRAKRPRDWAALTAKYDPKGDFERRYSTTTGPPTATPASAAATTPGHAKTPRSAPKPTASTEARASASRARGRAATAAATTTTRTQTATPA